MIEVSDDALVKGVQDYWVVRIDGGSPYANILDAFLPVAQSRFDLSMYLLAGPHRGAVIRPEQYWRVAERLTRESWGVEKDLPQAALELRARKQSH